ncbi:MAG TPA: succinylglutamate desuccinylase, partial [Firmicutes bacterium]|nr:succinylglutamate desuccinylase [Bacillota bacterium]
DWRVARHVTGLKTLFSTMGDLDPEQALHVSGVPSYEEIVTLGVGAYLGKEAP